MAKIIRTPSRGGKPMAKLDFKESLSVFKRLFKELGSFRIRVIIVFISIVLHSVSYAVGTMYLKEILTFIFENAANGVVDFKGLAEMMAWFIFIDVIGILTITVASRMTLTIAASMLCQLRVKMFDHMQKLPISYFDRNIHGEIMSRYTNDTDAIRELLSNGFRELINGAVTVLSVFVSMLILSPILTLIVIGNLILMGFLVVIVTGKTGKYFLGIQKQTADVNGYVEEYIAGQKVVKVFCHENVVVKGFGKKNDELRIIGTKGSTYAQILMPLLGNLSYLNYAIVAIGGSSLIALGKMGSMAAGIATLVMFLQLARQIGRPVAMISQQFNAVMMALAGAKRVFDMMDEPVEVDDGYVTLVNIQRDENGEIRECDCRTGSWAWKHPHKDGSLTYKELKGDIQFEDVSFQYVKDKKVLKNVDLYAKPGQQIAFVGATGAGKTTITNLINRFYDIPDGKIRYDGININKIKKADLRRSLAMVLQDTHLFTGTVMDNIRYGKLDATDEEVMKAAEVANATSFISHLPEGFNTMLTSDGANLSQGQRQLISIARAAVADPPVLILDEATSSIDTRTEAAIQKGLAQLMKGKTVFIIAHRLSTVRNADAILVLQDGEIIERGDHDKLMLLRGKYYQLYNGLFSWE
ncbi:MAG: putative ABC transporter ATP-binding protein [Firmicutes bacterium ADurb.Bin080]|jgi:ATP-binding cassette, subfamily B, multidrug efflux pump|nr:ABC transporter ATP-binding protein [Clostridiales bacterium]OQC14984.1 MAG: putative ABC transporter ATP-binding protein [Firmicutes bacterium ADurb.Bin080]